MCGPLAPNLGTVCAESATNTSPCCIERSLNIHKDLLHDLTCCDQWWMFNDGRLTNSKWQVSGCNGKDTYNKKKNAQVICYLMKQSIVRHAKNYSNFKFPLACKHTVLVHKNI